MILDQINAPGDIKNVSESDYDTLAGEIREYLIDRVSQTGGHLASNLGAVELTMALHVFLDFPKDKLIWDVGHQSYTHKILTGRKAGFDTLRKFGGMSGFPKSSESECDCYDTGHSSTSISAALGMVAARDLMNQDSTIVAVIGDGALTGGMAYEALNNASELETNLIIILNDNKMSISPNVGGVSRYLDSIRTWDKYLGLKDNIYNTLKEIPKYGDPLVNSIRNVKHRMKSLVLPGMLFENLGVTYLGPVDGHDVGSLLQVLKDARRIKGAVLIHAITQKGRGYEPARKHPARFHGTSPFVVETGLPKKNKDRSDYSDVFSTVVLKMAERDERVVAVTAAMEEGVGLKRFRNRYPDRFFDVGIAEQHAVTFAAGLAKGGLRPVVAIYSSFLQRAYDQILEDVCMQRLPVILAVDRAGIVGSDGETHQGIFDLSFLGQMPGLTVMAPKNKWELSDMMKFALTLDGPSAIRYPRGEAYDGFRENRERIILGRSELLHGGKDICIIALGSMVKTAGEVCELLKGEGLAPTLINARFSNPADRTSYAAAAASHRLLVTLEDNIISGGFGERLKSEISTAFLSGNAGDCGSEAPEGQELSRGGHTDILNIAYPTAFIEHGSVDELAAKYGMDAAGIAEKIMVRWRDM